MGDFNQAAESTVQFRKGKLAFYVDECNIYFVAGCSY